MRKLIQTIFVAAAILFATTASAQVKFGLKGGVNVSNMSLSSELLESSNRMGFFVGPTLKVTLPLTGLSADISALYNQSDSKLGDETVSQKYIDIPLNARFGIGLGPVGVFAFAGPQMSFNVGNENFNWNKENDYKSTFQMKKSLFSVNVGAGFTVSNVQVTANYNVPIGKTGDLSVDDVVNNTVGTAITGKTKVRNNTWQVGLAYFF